MFIDLVGSDSDFFQTAFFGGPNGLDDVQIISFTATQAIVQNTSTGATTVISGAGFTADAENNPTGGTVTSVTFYAPNSTTSAIFSNFSWSLPAFFSAILAIDESDDASELFALFDASGVFDIAAGTATVGTDLELGGLQTAIYFAGSSYADYLEGGAGDDTLEGLDGNDTLFGGAGHDRLYGGNGDDWLNPGGDGGTRSWDRLRPGAGNDTVDLGDVGTGGLGINHYELSAGINVTINGVTNTGSIDKGVNGTTTILDVVNPMNNWGLGIDGSSYDDIYNIHLTDGQWLRIWNNGGSNTINVSGDGGVVRLSYGGVTSGISVNLVTGIISDNGTGGTDRIIGSGPTIEISGSSHADTILGSAADEQFILGSGADTLDAGGGWDVLRYDRSGVDAVTVNLAAGTATGVWSGSAFTHTLSNVEEVWGSLNGNDSLVGNALDNTFFGEGGNDTLRGGDGSDRLYGGDGNDYLNLGSNSSSDTAYAGAGQDTIDFSDVVGSMSFYNINHYNLNAGITATINGVTNTGTIDKGINGTTTLTNVANALTVGVGMRLYGTKYDDVFNITPGDGGSLRIAAEGGHDVFNIGASAGEVILEFRFGISGANINLATGVVSNDGFGSSDTINGPGHVTWLRATFDDDTIVGSSHDEIFSLYSGNDTLDGGGGFDTLDYDSGPGANYDSLQVDLAAGTATGNYDGNAFSHSFSNIEGVEGSNYTDDTLFGNSADNELRGNIGNDLLDGRVGNDTLGGGEGNDTLYGGLGNDLIYGDSGHDTIYGDQGNDIVYGGDGMDMVYLGNGNDVFFDNTQGGELGRDTVYGGNGNDTIQGGNGDDKFHGGADNDLIYGRLGNDLIYGDSGHDTIYGDQGNDIVYGGDGMDIVYLGNGNDVFFDNTQGGELGRDTVYGGNGNDTIQGGNGDDKFHGGADNDLIYGRLGNDLIYGDSGHDTIYGDQGNDIVYGGDGMDIVYLGNGNDVFFDNTQGGELGRDTVYGGNGNDILNMGGGADVLIFAPNFGNDVVNGYEAGIDTLKLDDALWFGTLTAAQVVDQYASVVGSNVVFDFGGGQSITLTGITSLTGLEDDLLLF